MMIFWERPNVLNEVPRSRLQLIDQGRQPPSRRGHRRHLLGAGTYYWMNQADFGCPHSNVVPSTQTQWRMTAILRAIATLAFFIPIRLISRTPMHSGSTTSWSGEQGAVSQFTLPDASRNRRFGPIGDMDDLITTSES
jgi:hypothetical protein